jgi:hypothetical protein
MEKIKSGVRHKSTKVRFVIVEIRAG